MGNKKNKKQKSLNIPYYLLYPNAEWRNIILDGEVSKYKVSNEGVVVSFHKKEPKIINGYIMKSGYKIYCLKHNGKEYWMLGQRIVALTFIPIPEKLKDYNIDELEVNHIKGDYINKSNNNVNNLEWCTSSENKYHAYKTGLKKDCEDHPEAKYNNNQIHKVCYLLELNKLSRMEISNETGVDDCTIGMILSGKQWKTISKYYDFSKRKKKHTLYSKDTINKALELLKNKDTNNMNFSDIGRQVGMSRSSIWYLYNKHFKNQ